MQYIDAVLDKVYVVPCWIYLLSQGDIFFVQLILWILIIIEGLSAYVRTKAYYTAPNSNVEVVRSSLKSTSDSSVKSDEVGKAKQTFQMVGSALFVLPILKYIGFVLLVGSVPLACEYIHLNRTLYFIFVVRY